MTSMTKNRLWHHYVGACILKRMQEGIPHVMVVCLQYSCVTHVLWQMCENPWMV